ncbi:exodeoxyribonuclease V subunit gamma [Shewanella livingstonensis]|uniref:RecBCD enzyme subunit RecC n=1 Tax=Shewanella livingstonensis TaxID=150120 RepID=A0A3G8LTL1_9GAMM|nr:exodeoxyribonuclease V subunit gamma [Shewanella livingstonensis]AZG72797.1 exodeoxyribonuclease V subunit gamma [Shewanella livingstonensis]
MLTLIQSNQMEVLSEQLAKLLAIRLDNVSLLASEHVLVQSPGMSTWLRLEIAKHNGIAAALSFPLPSSFTWQLCHDLLPDVPKDNAFTKAAMTWKLMDLLPSLLDNPDFSPLKQYLSPQVDSTTDIADTDTETDIDANTTNSHAILQLNQSHDAIKLFQLCGRIADIFDQYLVYRPEWILAWEQNQPLSSLDNRLALDENQQWQPILWRALIDYNQHHLHASHYHRANLHADLIATLANPDTDLSMLPARLYVFGISSMPPQTLDVLYHLASRIDVIMLSLSPCQHYWGDIVEPKTRARMALQYANKKQLDQDWEDKLEVGNPILANNGQMGRELLDLMLSLPPEHTDFGYDCYVEPEPNNLLHGVQYDILQMETLGQPLGPNADLYQDIDARRKLLPSDNSITLRSCHSALREVETLHDHLLALLSNNSELTPKDIVIMMPDVAAYAPYIDAVFGTANSQYFADKNPQKGDYYIPYAIADRGAAQESPLINSFLSLLNINQSRFGLTDIIGILEVPAILRRFQLDDDELSLIRRWLDDANVRWGRSEQTRSQLGVQPFAQNSWAFGIKRLILGYAFNDDADIYRDTLMVQGIEGQSSQALGKLLNFLETIDTYFTLFASDYSTSERLEQLQQLLVDCYDTTDDEREQIQAIRDALVTLDTELESAGHQGQVDIEVLKQWFNQRLTESRVGQRYLAGSVNFCTLMPMRSIPFKVVCLLGMNDGVYPRVQHPVGFDLMAHFGPKKGDRSRRLDDRYLFLEALLSAREQLYISYIGHSERDNAERIASMLVSELVEYCQLSYLPLKLAQQPEQQAKINLDDADKAVLAQLIQAQPLQPFDAKLFRETPQSADSVNKLQHSFNAQWCPPPANATINNHFFEQALPLSTEQADEVFAHTHINSEGIKVVELELSALIRFYRNPAQFFFNRSLKVDLSLDIQADDNDEPFSLNALERYLLQSRMLDNAIEHQLDSPDHELLSKLKTSGELPMAPFDDLLINQYLRDISPLINRVQFLQDQQAMHTLNVDVNFDLPLPMHDFPEHDLSAHGLPVQADSPQNSQPSFMRVNLVGRIDDILPKGLVNYRPGTAHGRDFIRVYLRHLCIHAMASSSSSGLGKNQFSYLLDIGHFHAFAPITAEQAKAQLMRFIIGFIQGQTQPLCFMPKTAFAYVETDGDHEEKLLKAQKKWDDGQNQFGEGHDPHNQRLFHFPEDFSEARFGALASHLLQPMLSQYHKDKLAELDTFVSGTAVDIQAQLIANAAKLGAH